MKRFSDPFIKAATPASHKPRETRGPIETIPEACHLAYRFLKVTSRAKRAALLKPITKLEAGDTIRAVTSRAKRAALLKLPADPPDTQERRVVTSRAKRAALLKLRTRGAVAGSYRDVTSRAKRAALLKLI